MFTSTRLLSLAALYYPLGNTPAVSLTQDLPPEQDADILFLGCGDVRKILLSFFADAARKMDVTCCDIQPGIHARNVLLYTLLIDDKENLNVELIWNIYYHCKLDRRSVAFLETQLQKLLEVSDTIDQWHGSVYGSTIRFCDEKSLSLVRSYWMGYRMGGLSDSEKADRVRKMQATLDEAKAVRKQVLGDRCASCDLNCTSPVLHSTAMDDLETVARQWWTCCGTTFYSPVSCFETTELNPLFLYSPYQESILNFALSPMCGFPLSFAYTQITKGSPFYLERKPSYEYVVDCAKNLFAQWASAFRRAVSNKSVIRIFCGDALAFCWILYNFQLTRPACSSSMNFFSDSRSSTPVNLHHVDYGNGKCAAPLRFDVIDTSNLADNLGPLNIISVGSSLLKYNASSSLYMETLYQYESLSDFFDVDAHTISLLFGLVAPHLFTNTIDSFEDDITTERLAGLQTTQQRLRSRLRWKRVQGCQERNSPYMYVEANSLANFLMKVHDAMFKYDDHRLFLALKKLPKQKELNYTRASFAMLLNLLRTNVISDWEQCVKQLSRSLNVLGPFEDSVQDILLQMHLFGEDSDNFSPPSKSEGGAPFLMNLLGLNDDDDYTTFRKPTPSDMSDAILAPILPLSANGKIPEQLCVTIRVPRKRVKHYAGIHYDKLTIMALVCSFEGEKPSKMVGSLPWTNTFSAVQITYGTWHELSNKENVYPYIDEDNFQLYGTADMFVSVYVPTLILLKSKSVPWVTCELSQTTQNFMRVARCFNKEDIRLARYEMTSKDVKVTRCMPGTSGLPLFPRFSTKQDKPTLAATTVLLTQDGSKVDKVIQRINVDSQPAKTDLAITSSKVKVEFKSPFTALVTVAQSHKLKLDFPVPVSPFEYKVKIARKSSYIEVESPLFNPLEEEEDAACFLFPTFITKAPSGAIAPVLWTSTRIGLDAMPSMDLTNSHGILWLKTHASLMFSEREGHIREPSSRTRVDIRTDVKDKIFSILMHYSNLTPPHGDIFGLHKTDGDFRILVFPSCLRLDLVNRTVVLDTAIIPLTKTLLADPKAVEFLQELSADHGLIRLEMSEDENRAWRAMMPALVERCRTAETWKHKRNCAYIQTNEAPLPESLSEDHVSPICSCGIGKFPSKYLEVQKKRLPNLGYMISKYATRAAIAPIFTSLYIESSSLKSFYLKTEDRLDKCKYCSRSRWANGLVDKQGLLRCAKCKVAKYCSRMCQKADWAKHKSSCGRE